MGIVNVFAQQNILVAPAQASDRVALVVGNADYPRSPLANPRNDAQAMATLLRKAGFSVVNIDCTIIAQAPKMAPHVATMAANIASACAIDAANVSVKAKTTERLGFTGRGEGIAAEAIALVERR